MIELVSRNKLYYYISLILVAISRSLPHSVLTVMFLDKGLRISDIVVIQAMYSLAVLIFEVPSGVWSDIYSRKKMYIVSSVLLIVVFLSAIYVNNFYILSMVWFIYGLSDAINSGTIEAQILSDIKESSLSEANKEKEINRFIKYSSQFTLISIIIGSSLGSYLFFLVNSYFYFFSIGLCVISSILISLLFKESSYAVGRKKGQTSLFKTHFKLSLSELRKSPELRMLFILSIIGQIFFQTHYQLWQSLFLEKNWSEDKLYVLYVIFQVLGFISYMVSIESIKKYKNKLFIVVLGTLLIIFLISNNNKYIVLGCYLFIVFVFTVLDYVLTTLFANKVSSKNISSIFSMKSSLSRVSAVVVLILSSYFLKSISTSELVIINFGLAFIASILVIWFSEKSRVK